MTQEFDKTILNLVHDKDDKRFTLNIHGTIAKVDYVIKNNKMHLTYAEVPSNLRGQGYGKILVEKTFEKLTEEGYSAIAVCGYTKAIARRSDHWKNIIG